ncbi:MAG: VOC family protein [Anaerolineaceae bacterium]|nr:VOC family protein [Anaerolineaceae bacterium]
MYKVTKYPHGTFSWAELQSTDTEASKRFLTALFGWSHVDIPISESMVYTMYSLDGENVAASNRMDDEMQKMGIPAYWNQYITVDDVDAIAPRIAELGGKVMAGPFDVFDSGRMLILSDPLGAAVSLWQARSHIGASLVNRPGAMAWNELATPDSAAAQAFYGALLGWEFAPEGPPGYMLIRNQGRSNGGILQMTDEWKMPDGTMMPAHWTVYFSVADIETAVEQVAALGGEALYETMDAGGVGRFRIVREPSGAVFTLIQLDEPEAWSE